MKKLLSVLLFLVVTPLFAAWVWQNNTWKNGSTGQLYYGGPATYPPGVNTFTPTATPYSTATPIPFSTGSQNTILGLASTGQSIIGAGGDENTLFGYGSGTYVGNVIGDTVFGANSGVTMTGTANTLMGAAAGRYLSTGNYNTFIGLDCGPFTTSANYNSALGTYSLYTNTTGYQNSAFGDYAGYSNTTGYNNVYFGLDSGYSNVTGAQNTYIGVQAGFSATGNNNVFIGYQAGYSDTNSGKLHITQANGDLITGDFSVGAVTICGKENAASFNIVPTPGMTATPGLSQDVTVDAGIAATPVVLHYSGGILVGHTP